MGVAEKVPRLYRESVIIVVKMLDSHGNLLGTSAL